ncbi:50S ribosomal protein L11 methyltransferase [Helicobacter turcicus]|uniref:Ribosomal protein L11 methyltransferase n=1 Tax=Helicobacter turcicus TaxID=2867412 RepID=A0ABS7JMC7_9HELI|nr:50S ribosomal protein L11 methyltransferase [Helicobacter turcicus]MBX7490546.1 50S ribosomal protein L11 methyltransferase [Helicobacter turcicus]MBX7545544.1 50S ribosomal protein L11 methyltransferase [Helicobacter turcicus]
MKSYYHCLSIKANNYIWLLQDKALEITGEAIEEIENGFLIRTEKSEKYVESLKAQLNAYAKEIEAIVEEEIKLELNVSVCANEDWIAKYRNSITPIECGDYYIHPSWHTEKVDKINIIIDPALAFGSGHHASTLGCLKALSALELKGKKVLDVGCGSGILSICAKKSGANVWACDTDEVAVDSTKENMRKNGVVLDKVFLGSLNRIPQERESFDIVVANILADIIVVLPLHDFVKVQGYLILSGILDKYVSKVLAKFKDFKVISQKINTEWATLVLQK